MSSTTLPGRGARAPATHATSLPQPRLLTDLAGFARAARDWDTLLAAAGHDEPYLTHHWLSAWYAHLGGGARPWIAVLADAGGWLAALPLARRVERWRGLPLRVLCLPVNQESGNLRGTLLARGATAARAAAAHALLAWLLARRDWDVLRLDGLDAATPGYAALWQALASLAPRRGAWRIVGSLFHLDSGTTPDPAAWLAGRDRNFRRHLREARNRLRATPALSFGSAWGATGLEQACALDARGTKAGRAGVVGLTGPVAAFYRAVVAGCDARAETGAGAGTGTGTAAGTGTGTRCRVDLLHLAGQPVAALTSLTRGRTVLLWHITHLACARAFSPGRLLVANCVDRVLASPRTRLDFNGRTGFVATWSDHAAPVIACPVYAPTLRGRLLHLREQVLPELLRPLRGRWPRAGLLPDPVRARADHVPGETPGEAPPATPEPEVEPVAPEPEIEPTPPAPEQAPEPPEEVPEVRPPGSPAAATAPGSPPAAGLPGALHGRPLYTCQDGRSALAAGLPALGLPAGCGILFPAYHCGAEAAVLERQGYQLQLYRVRRDLTVRTADLAAACNATTRALYLIHYLGLVQPLAPLRAFARAHGLAVIEDCAQALYSRYRHDTRDARDTRHARHAPSAAHADPAGGDGDTSGGAQPDEPVGARADLALYSLYKFIDLAEGGALLLRDARLPAPPALDRRGRAVVQLRAVARRARGDLGWGAAARSCLASVVARLGARHSNVDGAPRALHPAEQARLARADHAAIAMRRRANFARLAALCARRTLLTPLRATLAPGEVPLLFGVCTDHHEELCYQLRRHDIEAGLHWSTADSRFDLCGHADTVWLKTHLVVLPVHQSLDASAFARIAAALDACAPVATRAATVTNPAAGPRGGSAGVTPVTTGTDDAA